MVCSAVDPRTQPDNDRKTSIISIEGGITDNGIEHCRKTRSFGEFSDVFCGKIEERMCYIVTVATLPCGESDDSALSIYSYTDSMMASSSVSVS